MTTIKLEFCRDRRRRCRQLGEMIRDRHCTEDINTLLTRISEQIKCELEKAVGHLAVVVRAAPTTNSVIHRDCSTGTHLPAAFATVEAPLPEGRIRWAAEAVAASNQLYVVPQRMSPFAQRAV